MNLLVPNEIEIYFKDSSSSSPVSSIEKISNGILDVFIEDDFYSVSQSLGKSERIVRRFPIRRIEEVIEIFNGDYDA